MKTKTINNPFSAYDYELKGWEYTIPEGMEAIIQDGKVVVRQKESEDERIRKALIDSLTVSKYLGEIKFILQGATREECLTWLEKQKEQKPKFYPGDVIKCTSSGSLWVRCKDGDNIRSDGHTACIGGGFELASEEEAVQFFQELNENGYQWDCIKGRPMKKEQKPAEWSEEDEMMILTIIQTLEMLGGRGTTGMQIDWLKSLRPSWKPSEEQMEALKYVKEHIFLKDSRKWLGLKTLYEDLKKLM